MYLSDAIRAVVRDDVRVETQIRDGDVARVAWQVYEADGATVIVHYRTNATYVFDRLEVEETGDAVTITVIESHLTGKLPGAQRSATVELAAPLAARHVVDGVTGRRRAPFVRDPAFAREQFEQRLAEWRIGMRRADELAWHARQALGHGVDDRGIRRLAEGADPAAALPLPSSQDATRTVVRALLEEIADGTADVDYAASEIADVLAKPTTPPDVAVDLQAIASLANAGRPRVVAEARRLLGR